MRKFITCCLLLLISCNQKKDKTINFNTEIKTDTIRSYSINRGIALLNNRNYIGFNSLIFDKEFPSWIKDRSGATYRPDNYVFHPSLSDIKIPYVLFKRKDEAYFNVIKYNDTLQFKIFNDSD